MKESKGEVLKVKGPTGILAKHHSRSKIQSSSIQCACKQEEKREAIPRGAGGFP